MNDSWEQIDKNKKIYILSGKTIDKCPTKVYNIITVKEYLMSMAGRKPERRAYGRYGNDR